MITRKIGVFLLVIGLLLIGIAPQMKSVKKIDEQEEQPQYIYIDPSNWKFLDSNTGMVLYLGIGDLPVGPKTMKVYQINYPEFNKNLVGSIAKENNFTFKDPVKINDHEYDFTTLYGTVRIYDSTTLHLAPSGDYDPNDAIVKFPTEDEPAIVFSDRYIEKETAKEAAMKFIEEHGGLPDDAKLVDETPSFIRGWYGDEKEYTFNYSYNFALHRYIDDKYEVIGLGERLDISLNNTGGLYYYLKSWNTKYQSEKKEVNIHSSYEALQSINAIPLTVGMSSHTITKIELAYYHPDSFRQTLNLRPVWTYYLDDSTTALIIDAETLEQYYG